MKVLELLQHSVIGYLLAITFTLTFICLLFHTLLHKFGWAAPCKEKKRIKLLNGDTVRVVSPGDNINTTYAHAYIQQCGYRMFTPKECENLRTDERSRQRLSFVIARDDDGRFYSIDMSQYFLSTRISSNFDIVESLIPIKESVEQKETFSIPATATT
jgi:hypothetical protein